jgi:HK97 family phage major capsid protein
MSEVKELFDSLNKAFEDFKTANNERLKQIEAKGSADPLVENKVDGLNDKITELETKISEKEKEAQDRIDNLELDLKQRGLGGGGKMEDPDFKAEAKKFFMMTKGRPVESGEVDVEAYSAYKQAFDMYCRRGERGLSSDIRNALSVGSDPDGGQWVPASTTDRIIKKIFETSPMRQIAGNVTIGTDRIELPKDINEATSGGWVGEVETRSATATPEVGMQEIPVHEQYAMPQVTQKLLDDAQFDVEGWLADKVANILVRTENEKFVSGNGVMKPRGFTDYTSNTTNDASRSWGVLQHVLSGTSASLPDTPDELIELVHKVKSVYRQNASWVMNKTTRAGLRKLSGGTNDLYYFIPDMAGRPSANILGYPVVEFDDMSSAGSGNIVAGFGDFREGYLIVDRIGLRLLRDPYTNKPYIRLYTTKRVGGDVVNFDAIKLLKCTS